MCKSKLRISGMQKEVGEGICEFHIFDMGDYERAKPTELKNAYYHRWGFKKHGGPPPVPMHSRKSVDIDNFLSLQDTIKELGHDKIDVVDVFVSTKGSDPIYVFFCARLTTVLFPALKEN
jgi:predicted AlkP superfamily pyrophosphatase or phosphodiesterase